MGWATPLMRRWQGGDNVLASRRGRGLLVAIVVFAFVALRWFERREPWNSDDMDLFEATVAAAAGRHWVFGGSSIDPASTGAHIPHILHTAFRVGLLPLGVPAVWALGQSAAAYYVVPLLFSLLGFGALGWLAWTYFGVGAATLFAAVHLAWPFELEHSSLFLTDLPAAAVSLGSLCAIELAARRGGGQPNRWTVLAGLAGWETYLLRNNGLVLLAPAYLVLLWQRRTRAQTAQAIALAGLGVLVQQLLLVWRGFGWFYDWLSVRADFAGYAPFLPVYSWPGFALRQLEYQLTTFGHGPTGWLALAVLVGSLALHLLLFRYERRGLLLAVAAFGLFSWLVFSFSIYERVPGGVRATVPLNYRFSQPFTYSSLMVWAWAWDALRLRSTLPAKSARGEPTRWAWLSRGARLVLPVALVIFSVLALTKRAPETYRQSGTRTLVDALQAQITTAGSAVQIAGLGASLRVPRLFCCGGGAAPLWQPSAPEPLVASVEGGVRSLVLRDIPRELSLARYLAPEPRESYRGELDRLERGLWQGYDLGYVDATYALFTPRLPGSSPEPSQLVPLAKPDPKASQGLLRDVRCRVVAKGESGYGALRSGDDHGRPGWCQYTVAADARVLAGSGLPSDPGYVVRVTTEYDAPAAVLVDLVERSKRGVSRQRLRLPAGTSYLPVQPCRDACTKYLVYRIRTGSSGPPVRIHAAEWRPSSVVGAGDGADRGS